MTHENPPIIIVELSDLDTTPKITSRTRESLAVRADAQSEPVRLRYGETVELPVSSENTSRVETWEE